MTEKCCVISIKKVSVGFVLSMSNDLGARLWTRVVVFEVLIARLASQKSSKGREGSKGMHALDWSLGVTEARFGVRSEMKCSARSLECEIALWV